MNSLLSSINTTLNNSVGYVSNADKFGSPDRWEAADIGGTSSTVLTVTHPTLGVQPINWSAMDNTYVPVTVQLACDVVSQTGDLDGVLYGIALYHKQQIYSSSTPETYNYMTLWPPVFGE